MDNQLAAETGDGWRGGVDRPAQYWCDLYCFGLLAEPIEYDRVTARRRGLFGVLSRAAMYRLLGTAKTVQASVLQEMGVEFVQGDRLLALVDAASVDGSDGLDAPALDLGPATGAQPPIPPPDAVIVAAAAGITPD